jgi:hypothetical protein
VGYRPHTLLHRGSALMHRLVLRHGLLVVHRVLAAIADLLHQVGRLFQHRLSEAQQLLDGRLFLRISALLARVHHAPERSQPTR